MKYILVTGGVISGIGKGIIASSIGTILKSCGLHVTSIKIDPYINIDAGTFSPYEHGECPLAGSVLACLSWLAVNHLLCPILCAWCCLREPQAGAASTAGSAAAAVSQPQICSGLLLLLPRGSVSRL